MPDRRPRYRERDGVRARLRARRGAKFRMAAAARTDAACRPVAHSLRMSGGRLPTDEVLRDTRRSSQFGVDRGRHPVGGLRRARIPLLHSRLPRPEWLRPSHARQRCDVHASGRLASQTLHHPRSHRSRAGRHGHSPRPWGCCGGQPRGECWPATRILLLGASSSALSRACAVSAIVGSRQHHADLPATHRAGYPSRDSARRATVGFSDVG